MFRNASVLCLCLALCLWVSPLRADMWDQGTPDDGGTQTQNELVNATNQLHDLGAEPGPTMDQDWYKIGQPAYSSWEIVVDSLSANLSFALALDRISSDGSTVVQTSAGISSLGFTRSLRWANGTTAVNNQYVRVIPTSCSTNCAAADIYQLRVYETTYAVSRFNNTGSQATILIVQNKSASTVTGTIYFWNASGTLLHSLALNLPAKQSLVQNLDAITELQTASGSITLANTGRYGDLSGKATATDPITGFTFDTPLEPRSR